MKTFDVFKHPTQGYEAVKCGFSWPAFFFTWIWAFVKKLWLHGVMFIILTFILTFFETVFDNEGMIGISLAFSVLSLVLFFVFGFKGNEWRSNWLQKRGYSYIKTLEASSPDAATATIANKEQPSKPVQITGAANMADNTGRQLGEGRTRRKTKKRIYVISFLLAAVVAIIVGPVRSVLVDHFAFSDEDKAILRWLAKPDDPLRAQDSENRYFAELSRAIEAKKIVYLEYAGRKGISHRQVLPERLFRRGEHIYLEAFCLMRDEYRRFRLDRIKYLQVEPNSSR